MVTLLYDVHATPRDTTPCAVLCGLPVLIGCCARFMHAATPPGIEGIEHTQGYESLPATGETFVDEEVDTAGTPEKPCFFPPKVFRVPCQPF